MKTIIACAELIVGYQKMSIFFEILQYFINFIDTGKV